jgi:hypothetical protein
MSIPRVSITYHAAVIIASLLPGKYLTREAEQAIMEFYSAVVRTKNAIDAEKEPDT